jgi:hypothetical protein
MNTFETFNKHVTGKTLAGAILLYLGVLFFVRNTGIYVADWLTGWPLILLIVGIHSGIRNEFTKPAAFYMILFGMFFLAEDILSELGWNSDLPLFPVIIIGFGIHLMLGKNKTVNKPVSS